LGSETPRRDSVRSCPVCKIDLGTITSHFFLSIEKDIYQQIHYNIFEDDPIQKTHPTSQTKSQKRNPTSQKIHQKGSSACQKNSTADTFAKEGKEKAIHNSNDSDAQTNISTAHRTPKQRQNHNHSERKKEGYQAI